MTISPFAIQELTHAIFWRLIESPEENSTDPLTCRCVSRLWKQRFDELIETLWRYLKADAPKGSIDIASRIGEIENAGSLFDKFTAKIGTILGRSIVSKTSALIGFKALGQVFKRLGANIESTPISIHQFGTLQSEFDRALMTIWQNRLWQAIQPSPPTMPPADATAQEIREFLNDPVNRTALTEITLLELDGLQLTVVPPELMLLSNLEFFDLDNNRLTAVPDFNFPKLKVLRIINNYLSEFPCFTNLPTSTHIYLYNNAFIFIPTEISSQYTDDNPYSVFHKLYLLQLNHPCKSALAILCQAIMRREPIQRQRELFNALDEKDKNIIFEMVRKKAKTTITCDNLSDAQWEKHFALAVRQAVIKKLEWLSQEQKDQVYGRICDPSEQPQINDKQGFALDRFLRLADSLAEIIN